MELSQHGFMEELLHPRKETWTNLANIGGVTDFFPHELSFGPLDDTPILLSPNPSFLELISQTSSFDYPFTTLDEAYPVLDGFFVQDQDKCPSTMEGNGQSSCLEISDNHFVNGEEGKISCCKMEMEPMSSDINQVFDMGSCGLEKRRKKNKKLEGQPSKNLMAERRRRKRLNDRLCMLRSIVPKISKMDRTSILGDAIDYMKELLDRISKLQEEQQETGVNQLKLIADIRQLKTNGGLVKNSPTFDVERRDYDTRIDVSCGARPGLLLSTVSTLEALGLEVQQCVISCFSDFSFQASCSEVAEKRELISLADIKEAIFRNAGYGGICF